MIRLNTILHNDYDGRAKISKHNLFYYSPERFKTKCEGDQDAQVIGETCENNRKQAFAELNTCESLRVSKPQTISRFLYKKAGYICVGDNQYVLLMKSRLPFIICAGTGMAALAGMLIVCWCLLTAEPKGPTEIAPYNPLPPVDQSAIKTEETAQQPVDGGQKVVRMQYTAAAVIDISEGSILVDMTNPGNSTQAMILELYISSDDGDIKIAESGLIPSGHALPKMQMIENVVILHEGLYHGKFLLSYYDPNTGEKAIVNSWIDNVKIIAQE